MNPLGGASTRVPNPYETLVNQAADFSEYDPRHQHHTLIAMDSFGPYFVTSLGKPDASGKLRRLGSDDDPAMKAMGFTKEFVHVVDFESADAFSIEVRFIDTRTPERKEMKFMTYTFARSTKATPPPPNP